MLLTVPILSKGSFLGSLINKCRQVVRIKPVNKIETNIKPNISTSITTQTLTNSSLTPPASSLTVAAVEKINRPITVANFSLTKHFNAVKTLEEKAGLPPKPKKPLTPYFRYMKEERPKIQAENPKRPLLEIVKQLSKQWPNVDPTVKQRLQDEYKKEQQTYIEARTKYDAKITDEQRSQLKALKQQVIEGKERRMMKKRIKDLGKPKKPSSGFLLFLSKERLSSPRSSNETFQQWLKNVTAKWKKMPEEERNVYIMESRKEHEKYKIEIALWEEKMIRLGNIDVVRHCNLIDPPEPKPKRH